MKKMCTTTSHCRRGVKNVKCHFASSVSKYEGVSRAGQLLAANQKNINQGLQCNREESTNAPCETEQHVRDQMLSGWIALKQAWLPMLLQMATGKRVLSDLS